MKTTNSRRAFSLGLAAIVSVATIQSSLGQSEPAEAPLSGPKVNRSANAADTGRKTLVAREFDGALKRLESEPVNAAIAVMQLTQSDRAAAEKILLERKAALDAILRDNIPLVLQSQGAFQKGDDGRGQKAVSELFEKASGIFKQGTLLDQVCAAIPKDKARELRGLYSEYMAAAVQDRLDSGPADKKTDKFGARVAEGFVNFQREIEDSAKRVFEGGDKEFKELAQKLDLTPEQESQVQALFLNLYADSKGKPTKAEQAGALLKGLALLTPEQKVKLREIVAQEAREAGRAKRAEKK